MNLFAQMLQMSLAANADGRVALQMLPAVAWVTEVYQDEAWDTRLERRLLPPEFCQKIAHSTCEDFLAFRGGQLLLAAETGGVILRFEEFLEYWLQLLAGSNFTSTWGNITRELRPWSSSATHNLVRNLCGLDGMCHAEEPPAEVMQRLRAMIPLTEMNDGQAN
jgi:hypothetical protein